MPAADLRPQKQATYQCLLNWSHSLPLAPFLGKTPGMSIIPGVGIARGKSALC